MQRRTTIWFLLIFHPLLIVSAQNQTDLYECKIGSVNPLASTSLSACYKLYDTPKNYQAARRHCVSLGGQLAEKINKDDSSLYSANADLAVGNVTQFWVGASNLKCNIGWENGGEIEFNELWAPESRYYGVAIDKMSLGGLWHTVPVGHQLPFVCTFQGKPKNAPPPVHALRAPAKKRVGKEEKTGKEEKKKEEDDIDDSLNAALADEKKKKDEKKDEKEKKTQKEEKKIEEEKKKEDTSQNLSATASDQKALAVSASAASSNSSQSSEETMDSAEIEMRKEVGMVAVAMMSQQMASQSEAYDSYTTEDLLSAAASLIGGYTVNLNWVDSSTTTSSTFDSRTDERSFSMTLTFAEQRALAMEARSRMESSTSESNFDQMSEEALIELAMAAATQEKSQTKSESSSKDETSDSVSMEERKNDEQADVMSAASILGGKKTETTKVPVTSSTAQTSTTTIKPTTTTEEDIEDSMNAALADEKKSTTKKTDLTTVVTTSLVAGAINPEHEKIRGCPGEWTQFNTNSTTPPLCFRRFDKPMNFEDARLFCLARGGHLASIHNERQLLLLSALLHNNGPDTISNQTWIGLNRIHQKYYVYEDETAMDFTRWLPGAPNINDCTVFTGNELPNYPHKGTQYKFGDFPCEEVQKSVLCEVTIGNSKQTSEPTCEEGWSYYSFDGTTANGKCYKKIEQSKKFTEARETCRHENAYVASIQNDGEARFVSALVQTAKNYTVNEQTWIGYVKYDNKDYGWEDGNKGVQFDPWTEKLPKDKKCTMFTGNEIHEDCRSQFRFVSVDCNVKQRAVLCSKPPIKDGIKYTFKPNENSSKPI